MGCSFLHALADEAREYHDLLRDLERTWLSARRTAAGRRSTSRAGLAIDVLAAAPLLSATTLARATGLSIKSASAIMDGFVADEIAIEVTHRSARRVFGLAGLAPVRDATTAPRRPQPGRAGGVRAWSTKPRSSRCRRPYHPRSPVSNGRPSTMRPSRRPWWNASGSSGRRDPRWTEFDTQGSRPTRVHRSRMTISPWGLIASQKARRRLGP